MPVIHPFKGLRYNPEKVGSLARVVTPPYDVISPEGREALYRSHPRNFIRIVYGKPRSSDGSRNNPHTRAKASLEAWVHGDVLRKDTQPSLYPYEQAFRIGGKRHRRLGVIALVRLDSRVHPHEWTFGGPKRERLGLMRTVNALLDPIFGLVPDETGRYRKAVEAAVRSVRPAASFLFQGVRHRLWRISDPAVIRKLQAALRSKELVIADGHHRFEAARAYLRERKQRRASYDPKAPYNFVMFYLSAAALQDPGLLPTHRLVRVRPPARLKELLEEEKARGRAEPFPSRGRLIGRLRDLGKRGRVGIGLYTGNGAGWLLRPPAGLSGKLDVEWLQQEILERRLGGEPRVAVSYTQDLDLAYRRVRAGKSQGVFIMQPPALREVFRRALSSRRMPRKTTYFYPKLVSGLVELPFEG